MLVPVISYIHAAINCIKLPHQRRIFLYLEINRTLKKMLFVMLSRNHKTQIAISLDFPVMENVIYSIPSEYYKVLTVEIKHLITKWSNS